MKYIIYFFITIFLAWALIFFYQTVSIVDGEWQEGSPSIISLEPQNTRISFSVTKPGVIYWRIYKDNIFIPKAVDLTNTNNLSEVLHYGGNFTEGQRYNYTNSIKNLEANKNYNLYAITVSHIGTFPREVKNISFTTLEK